MAREIDQRDERISWRVGDHGSGIEAKVIGGTLGDASSTLSNCKVK